MMEPTQETIDLIKGFEGRRLFAYLDSAGVPTIGYGHTRDVKMGDVITEAGAEAFLRQDLAEAVAAVNRIIKKPMTDHEFGAFVSLVYNIGSGAFGRSTAARAFNKGDKVRSKEGILMWNKITRNGKKIVSQGLKNRRALEVQFFDTPDGPDVVFPHMPDPLPDMAQMADVRDAIKPKPKVNPVVAGGAVALVAAFGVWWDQITAWIGGFFG